MPDDALDITIEADERPAVTALGRVNAALKETGNVAVSVGVITGLLELQARGLIECHVLDPDGRELHRPEDVRL
jgi:hypothetical protein